MWINTNPLTVLRTHAPSGRTANPGKVWAEALLGTGSGLRHQLLGLGVVNDMVVLTDSWIDSESLGDLNFGVALSADLAQTEPAISSLSSLVLSPRGREAEGRIDEFVDPIAHADAIKFRDEVSNVIDLLGSVTSGGAEAGQRAAELLEDQLLMLVDLSIERGHWMIGPSVAVQIEQSAFGFALALDLSGAPGAARAMLSIGLAAVGFVSMPLAIAGAVGSIALSIADARGLDTTIALLQRRGMGPGEN